MAASWIPTLALVAGIAVLAPILSELSGKLGVPAMVLEIILGIVVGPDVLKLAHPGSVVSGFSDMGLAFLMFLAGYELDLRRIRGRPLRLATVSWVSSVVVAVGFSLAVVATGLEHDPVVFGLTLTTTALGTVLPVLRDAGVLETEFGRHVMAAGTIGEFGPIVAVSVFLTERHPAITILLLVVFFVTAVSAALLANRPQQPHVVAMLGRHLHSSSQLPVRISVLFIFLLIYLAFTLGIDVLLGAVAAGVVVRLFTEGDDSPVIRGKL
ncbi:MAG: cation:proton antiporter, partial [Acidimicrobiales bacterium]